MKSAPQPHSFILSVSACTTSSKGPPQATGLSNLQPITGQTDGHEASAISCHAQELAKLARLQRMRQLLHNRTDRPESLPELPGPAYPRSLIGRRSSSAMKQMNEAALCDQPAPGRGRVSNAMPSAEWALHNWRHPRGTVKPQGPLLWVYSRARRVEPDPPQRPPSDIVCASMSVTYSTLSVLCQSHACLELSPCSLCRRSTCRVGRQGTK